MPRWRRLPLLLYALVLISVGLAIHLAGAVAFALARMLAPGLLAPASSAWLLVVSGGLILLAGGLAAVDLFVFLPKKRQRTDIMMEPPAVRDLTVVLTEIGRAHV